MDNTLLERQMGVQKFPPLVENEQFMRIITPQNDPITNSEEQNTFTFSPRQLNSDLQN
jgi:hypothetical protein